MEYRIYFISSLWLRLRCKIVRWGIIPIKNLSTNVRQHYLLTAYMTAVTGGSYWDITVGRRTGPSVRTDPLFVRWLISTTVTSCWVTTRPESRKDIWIVALIMIGCSGQLLPTSKWCKINSNFLPQDGSKTCTVNCICNNEHPKLSEGRVIG